MTTIDPGACPHAGPGYNPSLTTDRCEWCGELFCSLCSPAEDRWTYCSVDCEEEDREDTERRMAEDD